ncbi:ABC transporter I family member 11, chloroplastic [Cicer arietinum]|uniref:ABC transporter I family member 11, chloroplastic n=1 Tax=Cicer arietinum TaxID=3827 RepID=UPI003CC51E33
MWDYDFLKLDSDSMFFDSFYQTPAPPIPISHSLHPPPSLATSFHPSIASCFLQPPLSSFPSSSSVSHSLRHSPQSHSLSLSHCRFKTRCGYSSLEVKDVSYQPPGTQLKLLNSVSFSLPEKSFGLIFGQSGSGKTTLLQLLAGISKPTSGSINIQNYGDDGNPSQSPEPLVPERVGIVFQFPERYRYKTN